MKIGYGRVSTPDQKIDLQIDALEKEGCDKIFTDVSSGAKTKRPGLDEALSYLRKGDMLVVWKLDRLGRTVIQLIKQIKEFEDEGIEFKSLQESIDTTSAMGKFIFHVLSAITEMERGMMLERTHAGLQAARDRGKFGGRKRVITPAKAKKCYKLQQMGNSIEDIAAMMKCSKPTVYKHVAEVTRLIEEGSITLKEIREIK